MPNEMSAELNTGTVVWAKFSGKIYTGILEESLDIEKFFVRWFPDLKQCSYVKPQQVWEYRENRELFLSKRFKELKTNSQWRKAVFAADNHLRIPSTDIPEARPSTRGSTSDVASTSSTGITAPKELQRVEEHVKLPPDPMDAIEMPDEDNQKTPERPFRSESRKDRDSKDNVADELNERMNLRHSSTLIERQSESVGKRGRGRPLKTDSSPVKRKSSETEMSPRKRGRPSKPATTLGPAPYSSKIACLPPIGPKSNPAFDEEFTLAQRKLSSNDLHQLPRVFAHDVNSTGNDSCEIGSIKYGFIGLRPLSLLIIKHLCALKAQVCFWDNDQRSIDQAKSIGATPCLSVFHVVDNADIIFTLLYSEEEVLHAYFTPGEGIVACADPSKGIVDLGTTNVNYVRHINQKLTEKRVAYLYCAALGNTVDAVDCKLSFCVAGSSRLYKDIADLLRSLGGPYEVPDGNWSDPVMALEAKSVSDMLVNSCNLAFCEALGMAQRLGLSTELMTRVMRHQTKEHFSQCIPEDPSMIGKTTDMVKMSSYKFPLPISRSEMVSLTSPRKQSPKKASPSHLRLLTQPVACAAASARCFSSLVDESDSNPQSLFPAMHLLISSKRTSDFSDNNEDVSSLFQRKSHLI